MKKIVLGVIAVVVLAAVLGGGSYALDRQRRREAWRLETERRARTRESLEAAFASADKHVTSAKKVFNDVEYAYNTAFYVRQETVQELAGPFVKDLDGATKELEAADAAFKDVPASKAVTAYRDALRDLIAAIDPTKKAIVFVAELTPKISSGSMSGAEWRQRTSGSNDRRQSLRLKQRGFEGVDAAHALLADELKALEASPAP